MKSYIIRNGCDMFAENHHHIYKSKKDRYQNMLTIINVYTS